MYVHWEAPADVRHPYPVVLVGGGGGQGLDYLGTPDAHIEIVRVIAECDLVVTHSLATGAVPVYTELGTKLVDIFRLDENGKVVEHWDVGAAISPNSANGNPEV